MQKIPSVAFPKLSFLNTLILFCISGSLFNNKSIPEIAISAVALPPSEKIDSLAC